MKNFKKLIVWQQGMKIWKLTYTLAMDLPKQEKYGLISQIHRVSSSIPANIAEGSSRRSNKDYNRFLEIALGSCFELETFLLGIKEINIYRKDFSKIDELLDCIDEEQKMIMSLMRRLKEK